MSTTTQNQNLIPVGYPELFEILREKIRTSQLKAALAVNYELLSLYWEIGTKILSKQKNEGWGSKTVETLAKDLRSAFPDMKGFSLTNVKYMVQFAKEYPDLTISQQPVGQIPWGHNILLFQKLTCMEERFWYAKKTIENGWSRNTLEMWIESDLYSRQGKAITNFAATLPHPDSDLAQAELKDPYCFDFLRMRERADEAEIEDGLVEHIQKVLVELGTGFAFVGRQYRIDVEGEEFLIDLLFYHFKLKRFVVVELKSGPFKPEYAGKIGFYLSAVDAQLKGPGDAPSIGMILCKTKKKLMVEYTLQDSRRPIGVATYTTKLVESLPQDLKTSLPTIEQIETELAKGKKAKKRIQHAHSKLK